MGYHIFWIQGNNQNSVGVGASATEHTITIPQPQISSLTHSFTIVALSSHLPSTVVGPTWARVGKAKNTICIAVPFHTMSFLSI